MEEGTLIKHGNENTNNKMVFGDSFDSGYKSDALEEKQEDKIELPGGVDINSQNDPVKMCSKCIRNKVNYIYIYIYSHQEHIIAKYVADVFSEWTIIALG